MGARPPLEAKYRAVLPLGLAVWFPHEGLWWQGAGLALSAVLMATGQPSPRFTKSRWFAYALNWLLPALTAAFCVLRSVARDWWGVLFGSLLFGFALVNAVSLEPSPERTRAYRRLSVAFVVSALFAIWRFYASWSKRPARKRTPPSSAQQSAKLGPLARSEDAAVAAQRLPRLLRRPRRRPRGRVPVSRTTRAGSVPNSGARSARG